MATLDERQRKGALNQTLLRDVNERVVALGTSGEEPRDWVDVLCECFDTDCVETISITLDEYDAIRRSPIRFPVRPGHVLFEIERVVETTDRYEVVEKFGEGGKLVAARDPRDGRNGDRA